MLKEVKMVAYNCSVVNFILAAIIFAFSIAPGALIGNQTTVFWIISIAAIVIPYLAK